VPPPILPHDREFLGRQAASPEAAIPRASLRALAPAGAATDAKARSTTRSACIVFGERAFDDAVFVADPPGGQELGQDMMADGADQIDVRAGEVAGGQNKLAAGSSTRQARDR